MWTAPRGRKVIVAMEKRSTDAPVTHAKGFSGTGACYSNVKLTGWFRIVQYVVINMWEQLSNMWEQLSACCP